MSKNKKSQSQHINYLEKPNIGGLQYIDFWEWYIERANYISPVPFTPKYHKKDKIIFYISESLASGIQGTVISANTIDYLTLQPLYDIKIDRKNKVVTNVPEWTITNKNFNQ